MEGGAPFCGYFTNMHNGLGVISVDVEDGRIDDTGDVRAVGRRARVAGVSGEANLIVCHHVDGTARRVVR